MMTTTTMMMMMMMMYCGARVSSGILSRESRRSAAQSSARENVAERFAEVRIEIGVDTGVHSGRQVAEPRERGKHVGWHLTRSTQTVREVGTEERQPKYDECEKHPDEGPFRSSLPAVDLYSCSAADPHWTRSSRSGTAADRFRLLPAQLRLIR